MKYSVAVLVLGFLSFPAWACDFNNPHSLSCQKETFDGKIFPLFKASVDLFNESWFTNQFTAESKGSAGVFKTIKSPSNPKKTCLVLNSDDSRVGNLQISAKQGKLKSAAIANFRNGNFRSNTQLVFSDEHTLVFGNRSTRQLFRCRVFDRVNAKHLTCQYFENEKFVGYLGFLPRTTDCR
jgi:hypothetical protein